MQREFESMRERNIMSAWQSGGTFEGRKVTDEMVLDFWGDKMKQVSKDDPLYEYYSNLKTQYTFDIAESKVTLAYAQHKMNEGEVASFYRRWAQKVPRHSEVYRDLMRNAARFVDAARAKAKDKAEGNKAARYAMQDRALYRQYEAASVFLGNMLTAWMREGDYLRGAAGGVGQEGDTGETLADLDIDIQGGENDPRALMLLLDAASEDPTWRRQVSRAMRRFDPSFNGELDQQYLVSLQKRRLSGLSHRVQLARRFGYESNIPALRQMKLYVRREMAQTRLLDEMDEYVIARNEFDSVWNDPEATFGELVGAFSQYGSDVLGIAQDVKQSQGQKFSPMLGALNGELRALTGEGLSGGATVGEGGAGVGDTGSEGQEGLEAMSTAGEFARIVEGVESGDYGIIRLQPGQGELFGPRSFQLVPVENPEQVLGGSYVVRPQTMGTYETLDWADPKTAKERFLGRGEAKVATGGGFAYAEFLRTVPINVEAPQMLASTGDVGFDPRTGRLVGSTIPSIGHDTLLGEVALDASGKPVAWGIYDTTGKMQWTTQSPFADSKTMGQGSLGADGQTWEVFANTKALTNSPVDPQDPAKVMRQYFDPLEVIDRTVIPNMTMDDGSMSEGSVYTSPSYVTAIMAGTDDTRRQLLDMDDDTLLGTMMLDPKFRAAPAQTQNEIFASVQTELTAMRDSRGTNDLFSTMSEAKGRTSGGTFSAADWGAATAERDREAPNVDATAASDVRSVGRGLPGGADALRSSLPSLFGDRSDDLDPRKSGDGTPAPTAAGLFWDPIPGINETTPSQVRGEQDQLFIGNALQRARDRIFDTVTARAASAIKPGISPTIRAPRIESVGGLLPQSLSGMGAGGARRVDPAVPRVPPPPPGFGSDRGRNRPGPPPVFQPPSMKPPRLGPPLPGQTPPRMGGGSAAFGGASTPAGRLFAGAYGTGTSGTKRLPGVGR